MRLKGKATVKQLVDLLKRSDFDLRLASDAAASLDLGAYLLERIACARREAALAIRAAEAIKQRSRAA